jgi:hypothetical protein
MKGWPKFYIRLSNVEFFDRDNCRVTRDAVGHELFNQRQGFIAGVVVTVLTVIGLAVSIPYWRWLGLLRP